MREQFRPYTMMIGPFTNTNASSVTLRDTGGVALKCNYISVEASAAAGEGGFIASIACDNLTTPLNNQLSANEAYGYDGSGFVGGSSKIKGGYPVEFVLDDKDRVSAINLELLSGADETYFILTYGQVWTGNPLRDQERPKGG